MKMKMEESIEKMGKLRGTTSRKKKKANSTSQKMLRKNFLPSGGVPTTVPHRLQFWGDFTSVCWAVPLVNLPPISQRFPVLN
jgi:hypothetical protein